MSQGGKTYEVRRKDLLYPELCYKINGVLFEVHNTIGPGHHEKYYQKAVAIGLTNEGVNFVEQYYVPLTFQDKQVGKYFLDFVIEDKVILELKRGRYIPRNVYEQTTQYLEVLNLKLAVIACFSHDVVITKRIVNHKKLAK
jgi:GxxExxY protein